jgi:hypothetical protein
MDSRGLSPRGAIYDKGAKTLKAAPPKLRPLIERALA